MRIVLATPLYPPDVAWPAPYTKELAHRLSPAYQVTIVTYGDLPEQIEGARIIATSKRRPLPLRLLSYTLALRRAAYTADLIYAENGASVELPLLLVKLMSRVPVILHLGDERSRRRAAQGGFLRMIENAAKKHAKKIVANSPAPRPEILPFEDYPTNAMAVYEASWQRHLEELGDIFIYAKQ
jgi:glycosyl transferase family 4